VARRSQVVPKPRHSNSSQDSNRSVAKVVEKTKVEKTKDIAKGGPRKSAMKGPKASPKVPSPRNSKEGHYSGGYRLDHCSVGYRLDRCSVKNSVADRSVGFDRASLEGDSPKSATQSKSFEPVVKPRSSRYGSLSAIVYVLFLYRFHYMIIFEVGSFYEGITVMCIS
jgi:hypothetical protein